MADDSFFEHLADLEPDGRENAAPSTLKSRIFSRLNQLQAEDGPLLDLAKCEQAGGHLCVFEKIVEIVPAGEAARQVNYCRVCHARVLGEMVEDAPIYWPGCPYAEFQNR